MYVAPLDMAINKSVMFRGVFYASQRERINYRIELVEKLCSDIEAFYKGVVTTDWRY